MSDLINLLQLSFGNFGNYKDRKIANDFINGLRISTAYTYDMGYETAVCDQNGVYPVERYDTKEEAIAGHNKWLKEATTLTEILQLGWGDLLNMEYVTLVKYNERPELL